MLERYGIDTGRPNVVFFGRVTRQKGIGHLLDAFRDLDPGIQLVLRAGAADTAELSREVAEGVHRLNEERGGVIWIEESLERDELAQLLSHATVVCVPSVYEPSGMVNMEAMACEAPVVASAVGGIPEIVVDGVTGLLVHFEPRSVSIPSRPIRSPTPTTWRPRSTGSSGTRPWPRSWAKPAAGGWSSSSAGPPWAGAPWSCTGPFWPDSTAGRPGKASRAVKADGRWSEILRVGAKTP